MLRGMEVVCCRDLAAGNPPWDPLLPPEILGDSPGDLGGTGCWEMLLRREGGLDPMKLRLGGCIPSPFPFSEPIWP